MSLDTIITLALGMAAAVYLAVTMRRSARRLLATSRGTGSACKSCSGCGSSAGHAESEETCQVRDTLVVLGQKSQ